MDIDMSFEDHTRQLAEDKGVLVVLLVDDVGSCICPFALATLDLVEVGLVKPDVHSFLEVSEVKLVVMTLSLIFDCSLV